jgi:3',5'-cyclic AMP phosphodiesterase CpdA
MINGYSSSIGETNLQYANWKRSVEPFWHYIPFNIGMGNHEAVVNIFDDGTKYGVQVDKWPFETSSAEKIFANNFVNPVNGPISEDDSGYDPKPNQQDFPSYNENVFYYTYDNIAMIVLNSNYWYAPTSKSIRETGGNPHGYIMDNQLKWLEETLGDVERNPDIDHVFVTIHTPAFPNGGHAGDDMWYDGSNSTRPTIAGQPVKKGIIQRRDEFLDLLINKNAKVVALLCGDEHNYSRMRLTRKTDIYPENYSWKKIKISRSFWQITNGSAGAPYYGQQQLPWSGSVEIFSTQYALMLFYVEGNKITLKVINPDTLEDIEEIILKE